MSGHFCKYFEIEKVWKLATISTKKENNNPVKTAVCITNKKYIYLCPIIGT